MGNLVHISIYPSFGDLVKRAISSSVIAVSFENRDWNL